METYIYYIEILSMVSLFLLYGLSVLLMLADDGDMRWTVLLNGRSGGTLGAKESCICFDGVKTVGTNTIISTPIPKWNTMIGNR